MSVGVDYYGQVGPPLCAMKCDKNTRENNNREMTEERKTRVHRSLREMENSANELADFLDDQRNRRRTVEIVVNQGDIKRCLTMNVDEIPDDGSMLRFNSKGSLCSGGSGRSSPAVREDLPYGTPMPTTPSVDTQAARWEKHHERRTKARKKVIQPESIHQEDTEESASSPNPSPKPPQDADQTEDIVTRLRRRLDEKKKRTVPDIPTEPEIIPKLPEPAPPVESSKKPEAATEKPEAAESVKTPEPEEKIPHSPKSEKAVPLEIPVLLQNPTKKEDSNSDSDPNSDSGISYNSAASDRADLTPLNFNLREIDELDDLALSQPSDEIISVNNQSDSDLCTNIINQPDQNPKTEKAVPIEISPIYDTITCQTSIPVTDNVPSVTNIIIMAEVAAAGPPTPPPETAREKILPSKYHNESYHEADTMIADDSSFTKINFQNSEEECEPTETITTEETPEVEPEVPEEPIIDHPEPKVEKKVEETVEPPKLNGTTNTVNDVPPEESSMPETEKEVGSVNDRLTMYTTKANETTPAKPAEKPPMGKISSIDKFKQNYLKKADAPSSGNSTPSGEVTVTPPGTMSLRERMKMFESKNKGDRVLARETVAQTERASDMKSKISLWGKSNNNVNNNAQREKIHVGSIDDRRSQYNSLAKI